VPNVINLNTGLAYALLMCVLLVLPSSASGQSAGAFKKEGDKYFAAKNYRSALTSYRQGRLESSSNKKVRLHIGICLYEINDVDGAMQIFQSLIREGKTAPEVFLWQGKCYQAKNKYTEAIALYKKYLQKIKSEDPNMPWAKDEIIRCANGARLKYGEEIAYLENAGTSINTRFDEFGVKTSPTTIDKIYFNSDREDIARAKRPDGNVDMYSTSLINGRWSTPTPLPPSVNSEGYDEVRGFSSDGQILYYLSPSGNNFIIRTDTFSTDQTIHAGRFSGPPSADTYLTDLVFFNDSICLYAADDPGGFGGYDLYISILQNDVWSPGINLGPSINSYYDERHPFLTQDGLTLFFSSNNLNSMGGLDIFSATFDNQKLLWSTPTNLGMPINSALDDSHFVLSPDGMTAYLNSKRKEGYGGEDIYRVFFKQPIMAHQQISVLPTFYHTITLAGKTGKKDKAQNEVAVEIKEYYISHLFFNENTEILSPQNTKKLDLLANLLTIYPKVNAELSCFELPAGQRTYTLYFSIKKAEKAAEYLVRKGIERDRLILKGYGASFPLISEPSPVLQSPLYEKLNQRLEITPHQHETEPVHLHIENIKTPEKLRDPHGIKFTELRHGLYYSVQIASIPQILQNQEIDGIKEMFIEVDNRQGNYLYMAGMFPSFKESQDMLAQMRSTGFHDAKIIPYLDGIRIGDKDIAELAKKYPDLLFYLAGKGK
jgi:outer membrane protein OmpA-like peptidoglycan-associated protein